MNCRFHSFLQAGTTELIVRASIKNHEHSNCWKGG